MWGIVLPLLDMGYQVDIRALDAVFYAVPQTRGVRRPSPHPMHVAPEQQNPLAGGLLDIGRTDRTHS